VKAGTLVPPPVQAMTARTAATLPAEDRAEQFSFEPKLDGFLN
jgi:ATP-dependent DNA ligase